jgi:quercetin dioxygenase-like cupin family protein
MTPQGFSLWSCDEVETPQAGSPVVYTCFATVVPISFTKEMNMNRIYILMFVLLVAGLVRSDASANHVQDPLIVNSKTIALKLENSRVRVLEATLKPGDKEKTHSHPAYVIYVIAGGKVRNHATDGTVSESEFRPGDVIYRDPITHWAENIGDTTIRLELIELKN